MSEWVGLAFSFGFVFGVIGIAQLLLHGRVLDAAATRKVVHIGVAHWWLIAMWAFDSLGVALIGPIAFILINALSYRTHLFRAMEHSEPRKNLGTIYFPVALTFLVVLSWGFAVPRWYGAIAVLVLGWGDGLASLFGERSTGRRFRIAGGTKSVAGTTAMVVGSWMAAAVVFWWAHGQGLTPNMHIDLAVPLAMVWPTPPAIPLVNWIAGPTAAALGGAIAAGFIVAASAAAVELVTPYGLDNISVPVVVVALVGGLTLLPAPWLVRVAIAFGLNVTAAALAYLKRAVTASGAIAGALVGITMWLAGGFFVWSLLMVFFVSSSALSRFKANDKRAIEKRHSKGSRRDAVQVLANGGLAALMAAGYALTGHLVLLFGCAIALAAANADTWASEVGVLSRRAPVSILTWQRLTPGTSGGVSVLGLIAATAGAALVALWFTVGYALMHGLTWFEMAAVAAAIAGGGFLGSLIDSVLGASIQAQYRDDRHGTFTERRFNSEGLHNTLVRGYHWITNDAVNALSGLISVLAIWWIAA